MDESGHIFAAPLGAATCGCLVFASGVAGVTIHADPALVDLYRAHFALHMPSVWAQGSTVTIQYHHLPFFNQLVEARAPLAEIMLNGAIPWELEFRSGVAQLNADLRRLPLRAFDVLGGASRVRLSLPWPVGTVYIYVAGGASDVTFHRPAGVGVRIRVGSGSGLTLDAQHVGVVGDDMCWESLDYAGAVDRYDIDIAGAASNVTIAAR